MKQSEINSVIPNFKVEELEPRFEMRKWSAKAEAEVNEETIIVPTEVRWEL